MDGISLRLPAFFPSRRASIASLSEWEPVTTRLGLALLALLPVLLLAAVLDPRTVGGVAVWAKPVKFALALGVYLLTLGFFGAHVDPVRRARPVFRWTIAAGAFAIVVEQAIVTLQSARGVGSHFNDATAFDAALYGAMGVGSLLLTAMTLPFAAGVARGRPGSTLDGGVRLAIIVGLVFTFAATLVTAGTMAAGTGSVRRVTPRRRRWR